MEGEGNVIVVGVDGSVEAEAAVRWALDEARLRGDKVVLVHAWEFPGVALTTYAGESLPVFGRDDLETLAADLLARVREAVEGWGSGVEVETRLVEGHPGAALADASRDARMLVVGSRGLGGFKGLLLGSVSTSCAHHARCPVVIVPAAG